MADPMYRQIAEDIRRMIESGELGRAGSQLPTELDLRERYMASRNTVRDAIKFLISLGLVETRPGQGTFIVQKIEPFINHLGTELNGGLGGGAGAFYLPEVTGSRGFEATTPQVEVQQASSILAGELQLPVGTQIVSRHQRRYIDSVPWSLQTSFYPMFFVERGATRLISADDIPAGVIRYLADTLHLKQVGWTERLAVRTPDEPEIAFFRLPADGRVALVESIRTGYDQNGMPFCVTATTYPADRNQFIISVGEVPVIGVAMAPEPAADRTADERMTGDRMVAVVALER
jgi:GntR family transcriptional regulator